MGPLPLRLPPKPKAVARTRPITIDRVVVPSKGARTRRRDRLRPLTVALSSSRLRATMEVPAPTTIVKVKALRSKTIEIEAKARGKGRLNSLRPSSNSSTSTRKCHLMTGKARLRQPRVARLHQRLSPPIRRVAKGQRLQVAKRRRTGRSVPLMAQSLATPLMKSLLQLLRCKSTLRLP